MLLVLYNHNPMWLIALSQYANEKTASVKLNDLPKVTA